MPSRLPTFCLVSQPATLLSGNCKTQYLSCVPRVTTSISSPTGEWSQGAWQVVHPGQPQKDRKDTGGITTAALCMRGHWDGRPAF